MSPKVPRAGVAALVVVVAGLATWWALRPRPEPSRWDEEAALEAWGVVPDEAGRLPDDAWGELEAVEPSDALRAAFGEDVPNPPRPVGTSNVERDLQRMEQRLSRMAQRGGVELSLDYGTILQGVGAGEIRPEEALVAAQAVSMEAIAALPDTLDPRVRSTMERLVDRMVRE